MQRTCVIYESKYGATKEIAGAIALVLGPARTCRPDEFTGDLMSFDLFVIGTPIYNGDIAPSIRRFVETNAGWLKKKPVALFCTCLNIPKGRAYLAELRDHLGREVPAVAFGGRLSTARLDRDDLTALTLYARKTGFVLEDHDLTDMGAVAAFALALREKNECLEGRVPEEELLAGIETFLRAHRTGVLATGHGDRVRATPIDYIYANGMVYIYSEGGEKFAHLIQNPAAALAIYNDDTSPEEIRGLQLMGRAEVLRPESPGHREALTLRGIDMERLAGLTIEMNVIRITPLKAEYLNAVFKKEGCAIRQVYRFPQAKSRVPLLQMP
ncbi:flavodoxin domain-containing protein [Methanofollis ethanolicus]|uniref:flavodoxin domain-containing protein n=1 Tax=Methanofollis ethanolicus TaxID=488124 RepID=UPI000834BAFF|nr:flavodoxin domain-containing protein [Methanofollis ethanolicus]